MKLIVTIPILGILIAFIIIAFSFYGNSPSSHSFHSEQVTNSHIGGIEDAPDIERRAEAKNLSKVILYNNVIDAANNCEFCNKVEYIPGPERRAAIWYILYNVDLTQYQRIVFFARGENGGEVVSFVAAGNDSPTNDVPPYRNFAVTTKNVTLGSEWKRYEISLYINSSEQIKYPFGFIITAREPGLKEIFYLKGVRLDPNPAQNPIPIDNPKA